MPGMPASAPTDDGFGHLEVEWLAGRPGAKWSTTPQGVIAAWVADMDFQYRGMVFLGDVYRIRGEIVDKWRGAKTGTGYVQGKFSSVNQRGTDVMPGTVIFALPSKETGALAFPINVEADGRID